MYNKFLNNGIGLQAYHKARLEEFIAAGQEWKMSSSRCSSPQVSTSSSDITKHLVDMTTSSIVKPIVTQADLDNQVMVN